MEYERSFSAESAHKTLNNWLIDKFSIQHLLCDTAYQTSSVLLTKYSDGSMCNGMGKGLYHKTGAVAEALEHYFGACEDYGDYVYLDASVVSSQDVFENCNIGRALGAFKNSLVKSTKTYEVSNGDIDYAFTYQKEFYVPVHLMNPFVDLDSVDVDNACHQFLLRYASNTGTALGMNRSDALLHAVNEQIERHYLSALYMNILGMSTEISFERIDYTKNAYLDKKVEILKKLCFNVDIVLSEGFCGMYFCAVITNPIKKFKNHLDYIGSGVSLSMFHALDRALSEALQVYSLMDNQDTRCDTAQKYRFLSSHNLLKKLISVDVSHLRMSDIRIHDDRMIDNDNNVGNRYFIKTKSMLKLVCSKLNKGGYRLLVRSKTSAKEPFSVMNTFIPGLDRFCLVREGSFVMPHSFLASNVSL